MGKSTVAAMFADLGIPVHDADATVHDLYRGEAVAPIEAAFPGTTQAGAVDRKLLSRRLSENPALFETLERIVHPMVRKAELAFLGRNRDAGCSLVLLDIPLLFETKAEDRVDAVVVVTCDPQIQRERVLKRPGMTREKFDLILSRQVPDAVKRAKADYIVDTGGALDSTRRQVAEIVKQLTSHEGP